MQYTRDISWKEFDDHFGTALIIFIIFGLLFSMAFFIGVSATIDSRTTQENVYSALAGLEVKEEKAVKAAQAIKELYQAKNLKNLQNLIEVTKIVSLDFARVQEILDKGDKSNISVPKPKWGDMLGLYAFIMWLWLSVCASFGYTFSDNQRDRDWWKFPWKKWWAYIAAMDMLPYVLIVQTGTLIFFLVRKIGGFDRRLAEENRGRQERRTREDNLMTINNIRYYRPTSLQNFIALNLKGIKSEKEEFEYGVRSLINQLQDLGRIIQEKQRELAEAKNNLSFCEKKVEKKKAAEELAREFNSLWNIPGVEAVMVDGSVINVYTDTIFIELHDRKYEIGKFRVEIKTRGEGAILIYNIQNTNTSDRKAHPFSTDKRGGFCFGSNDEKLKKALVESNFLPLITYIMEALKSSRGLDSVNLNRWKIVQ